MKLPKILIIFISLFFISITISAQSRKVEGSLNEGSIQEQFDYLFKISPKWQDYRSIKVNKLFKFRNNVYDSLKLGRKKLLESQKVIASQKINIDSLNSKLKATNVNLSSVTEEKDNIKFLGIPLSKATYNTILWSIIAALTGLLLFFIGKFKRSNAITITANKDKSEIEEEYNDHRQRSIEREQKLRRELQDELNKQKYENKATGKKK
jgi:hypothetical protein